MARDQSHSSEEKLTAASLASEPPVVYHYTSLDTMMKIVESRQLWATNVRFLNDTAERHLFLRRAETRIEKVLSEVPEASTKFFDQVNDGLLDEHRIFYLPSVVCFSKDGDSLPQWRAYSPKGTGISIGFRVASLKKAFVDMNRVGMSFFTHPRIRFGAVRYLQHLDREEIDLAIRQAYSDALRIARRSNRTKRLDERECDELAWQFRAKLQDLAMFYKDRSFSSEEEFRLVLGYIADGRPYQFRVNDWTLVPYLSAEVLNWDGPDGIYEKTDRGIPWNAIERVIIGPTVDKKVTAESVGAYFKGKRMNVRVATTKIPFRDW